MRRGDIWTLAGGPDYAGKPRPVVILQDDRFSGTASVTVCPLTSNETPAPLFRRVVEPSEANGLARPSRLMADKLTTVPRAKLGRRVGRLEAEHVAWIGQAMLVFLGFAGSQPADDPAGG
ncbi:type II toxin-antitoxin system PemK/MazF family toxin [Azospirillum sp. RWY-5-1]|uniref:Type II toxin-antitoxin system PemK/MazF family toxin n=1 Tax=Azospirillum oleiclasticum TaxID=2735135 RepID=A0ABX2TDB5_9PROT|nr:type II toxin-antitoxin system PemK/MazF family toxin [Azospirillum oleiclasticum]NYZ13717.1 type II toxin-antitoxin system PemK/MazF family toxin [Azospirillum oleiclasticum]NYZ20989.1 type II toxin-antitoxin system PemK/MazF family toxin [Azospirillum oleiclasticum]